MTTRQCLEYMRRDPATAVSCLNACARVAACFGTDQPDLAWPLVSKLFQELDGAGCITLRVPSGHSQEALDVLRAALAAATEKDTDA